MTILIGLALAALALPATLSCAYLLGLTLLSAAPPTVRRSARQLRFDVIVPAHNEESGIARTVASLRALDWPAERFRVLVIADNCTDATAALARQAGATVLERQDAKLRGKGYALAHGFDASLRDGVADGVVVIDADSEASPNLLEACAVRIEGGAEAVQAHYGVLNPRSSWRTELMAIALGAFHVVRSRARERLGLSCGIKGNGWCVTHALLRRHAYLSFSLVEDLEYAANLALAGVRVFYADEAHVLGDMVSSERIARRQRQRWEQGRFKIVRSRTLPLLHAALRRGSIVCLDMACDLLVLPLSYIVVNLAALIGLAALFGSFDPELTILAWWGLTCAFFLGLHVMRGWQVSGTGVRGLMALAHIPGYVIWKFFALFESKTSEWVRTEREKP